MPRYSIPNVPTKIDLNYQDPGNFGVYWGIYFLLCVRLNFADFRMVSQAARRTVNQPAFISEWDEH